MPRELILTALALAVACGRPGERPDSVRAAMSTEGHVVLRNGPNAIELLGDGTPAQAFVAWRGNYNAHGFSTVAIYLRARSDLGDSVPDWQIIPRFGGPHDGDSGREIVATSEGADCTLGDLRILQHRGRTAELILLAVISATHSLIPRRLISITTNSNGIPTDWLAGRLTTFSLFEHSTRDDRTAT